jgi:hypothetical protein
MPAMAQRAFLCASEARLPAMSFQIHPQLALPGSVAKSTNNANTADATRMTHSLHRLPA